MLLLLIFIVVVGVVVIVFIDGVVVCTVVIVDVTLRCTILLLMSLSRDVEYHIVVTLLISLLLPVWLLHSFVHYSVLLRPWYSCWLLVSVPLIRCYLMLSVIRLLMICPLLINCLLLLLKLLFVLRHYVIVVTVAWSTAFIISVILLRWWRTLLLFCCCCCCYCAVVYWPYCHWCDVAVVVVVVYLNDLFCYCCSIGWLLL